MPQSSPKPPAPRRRRQPAASCGDRLEPRPAWGRTDELRARSASTNDMRATNLENHDAAPVQDWVSVPDVLDGGFTPVPDSGGPNRFTTWLATLNADGSPHVTAVGAIWVD